MGVEFWNWGLGVVPARAPSGVGSARAARVAFTSGADARPLHRGLCTPGTARTPLKLAPQALPTPGAPSLVGISSMGGWTGRERTLFGDSPGQGEGADQ